MQFTSELIPLFIIYLGIILAFIGIKGFQYDQLKKEEDPHYNKIHSFLIHQGNLGTVMPFLIRDNSKDLRIKKAVKQYNKLAKIFWISLITGITGYVLMNP